MSLELSTQLDLKESQRFSNVKNYDFVVNKQSEEEILNELLNTKDEFQDPFEIEINPYNILNDQSNKEIVLYVEKNSLYESEFNLENQDHKINPISPLHLSGLNDTWLSQHSSESSIKNNLHISSPNSLNLTTHSTNISSKHINNENKYLNSKNSNHTLEINNLNRDSNLKNIGQYPFNSSIDNKLVTSEIFENNHFNNLNINELFSKEYEILHNESPLSQHNIYLYISMYQYIFTQELAKLKTMANNNNLGTCDISYLKRISNQNLGKNTTNKKLNSKYSSIDTNWRFVKNSLLKEQNVYEPYSKLISWEKFSTNLLPPSNDLNNENSFKNHLTYIIQLASLMKRKFFNSISSYYQILQWQKDVLFKDILQTLKPYFNCLNLDDLFEFIEQTDADYLLVTRDVENETSNLIQNYNNTNGLIDNSNIFENERITSILSDTVPCNSWSFYCDYLIYLESQQRIEECVFMYKIVRQFHEENFYFSDMILQWIEYLTILKRFHEGIEAIQISLSKHPLNKSRELKLRLARLFQLSFRFKEAITTWEDILEQFSFHPNEEKQIQTDLARSLLLHGKHKDLEKSMEIVDKNLEYFRYSNYNNVIKLENICLLCIIKYKFGKQNESVELATNLLQNIQDFENLYDSDFPIYQIFIFIHEFLYSHYEISQSFEDFQKKKIHQNKLRDLYKKYANKLGLTQDGQLLHFKQLQEIFGINEFGKSETIKSKEKLSKRKTESSKDLFELKNLEKSFKSTLSRSQSLFIEKERIVTGKSFSPLSCLFYEGLFNYYQMENKFKSSYPFSIQIKESISQFNNLSNQYESELSSNLKLNFSESKSKTNLIIDNSSNRYKFNANQSNNNSKNITSKDLMNLTLLKDLKDLKDSININANNSITNHQINNQKLWLSNSHIRFNTYNPTLQSGIKYNHIDQNNIQNSHSSSQIIPERMISSLYSFVNNTE